MFADVTGRLGRPAQAATVVLALAGYCGFAVAYAFRGTLNTDEGWYLLAAQRVAAGSLPYQDFLFTQPPLFPYLYTVPAAFGGSVAILLARVLSVCLATAAIILVARLLIRRSGYPAALMFSLLLATSPIVVYFLSITKTYAVVLLLLAVGWTAGSSWSSRWGVAVGAVAIAVAVGVRLTVAPFLILPAWHAWRRLPTWRDRLLSWGPAVGVVVVWITMMAADISAVRFGVFEFHSLYRHGDAVWREIPIVQRLVVFATRIPNALSAAPAATIFILITVTIAALETRRLRFTGPKSDTPIVAAAVVLYVVVHAAAGQFLAEYFVPVLPIALAVALLTWTNIQRRLSQTDPARGRFMTAIAASAVAASVAVAMFSPLPFFSRESSPHRELAKVVDLVAARTRPTDVVWALEGLWVNVAADRPPPRGMTMAQFSYVDLPTDEAQRIGAVNDAMIVDSVSRGKPGAIVLTQYDLQLLTQRSALDDRAGKGTAALLDALRGGYLCALYDQEWGQSRTPMWLLLPKTEVPNPMCAEVSASEFRE